jgi:MFS family permease
MGHDAGDAGVAPTRLTTVSTENQPVALSTANSTNASDAGQWVALWAALLGWMFDGFEQGMFSLAGRAAFTDLLGPARATQVSTWFGVIMAVFLVGAAAGGVLFGWLGDKVGRVRAMSLSILTYAIFTGACGLATQPWHLAVLRFVAALGIGGEWALGVALVVELWPDKSRAFVAGVVGASANVGFLLVGLLGLVLAQTVDHLAQILPQTGVFAWLLSGHGAGRGWRLLLISGSLPALLIFFIRLFVPESHKWERENARGATSHWAAADLLGVLAGSLAAGLVIYVWSPASAAWSSGALITARATATVGGIAVALLGFMFPVVRYMQRAVGAGMLPEGTVAPTVRRLLLGAALAGVPLLGTWGSVQWAAKWSAALSGGGNKTAEGWTLIYLAVGAVIGTIVAALVAGRFGRRITYAAMCLGSLGSCLLLYQTNDSYNARFLACTLLVGAMTAAFYGWFPLYLPELFRTSVRATSQGFAYNFGRIIAAIGTLQTAALMVLFKHPGWTQQQVERLSFPKAASVLSMIYLIGVVIIWLGPETKGKPLPE